MENWQEIKELLLSEIYEEPYQAIEQLIAMDSISDEALEFILHLDDNFLTADFLDGFNKFSYGQLLTLENYIMKNLSNSDRLFVSDLIDFARKNNFTVFYKNCIDFISSEKEDYNLILSSIIYISEKHNFTQISEIKTVLDKILEKENYYFNCQIVAAFYLFRLTFHQIYLEKLVQLLLHTPESNKELIAGVLKYPYNQPEYFVYHNLIASFLIPKYISLKT